MPLAKHRPDFAELISTAAVQRERLQHRQKTHYRHIRKTKRKRLSLEGNADDNNDETAEEAQEALYSITKHGVLIELSDKIRWFLDLFVIRCVRILVVVLAFLVLTFEAQTALGNHPNLDFAAMISDVVVSIYFIMEGTLKLFAFYAHLDMHRLFELKMEAAFFFRKLGLVDVVLGILSLYFGSNEIGGWIRLLRVLLFASIALDETPHLVILVSGITHGLMSIFSTCLLLFLVFMVYGAFGLYFFEKNDPYHFGTIALSVWTFFELGTLDNWSQVLYVNMYGCDQFPAYYTVVNSSYTGVLSISRYGSTLMLPICTTPERRPAESAIIFLSFIVLCAFIVVNLTIAAVTSGINVHLDRIKNEGSDMMNLNKIMGMTVAALQTEKETDLNKQLIEDPDLLLVMLKRVWREQDEHARKKLKQSLSTAAAAAANNKKKRLSVDSLALHHAHTKGTMSTASMTTASASGKHSVKKSSAPVPEIDEDNDLSVHHSHDNLNYFEFRGQSILFRDILSHYMYQYALFALIAFSALLVLVVLQRGSTHVLILSLNLALQLLFSVDLYMQLIATYPNFQLFIQNKWHCFDAVIVIVSWIPVFAWGRGSGVLGSSVVTLAYVYVLIFGVAYHFAVAGVFLFAENDPQHFGDLTSSFVTLFQVQSLDDWSEVARTNMYGCDYWGYDTGEEYYDSQCVAPHGLGWFAAFYFLIYIMISVMVLLSLFVGIIITSMELLKEGIKEENEVWEKVKVQQKRYHMRDGTINNLLEIFDLIDVGKNGKLTLLELKPIFDVITITEASQFSLFMMVDSDNSGQIDFSEFIELLYLVGKAYKAQCKSKRSKTKRIAPLSPLMMGGISTIAAIKNKLMSPSRARQKEKLNNNNVEINNLNSSMGLKDILTASANHRKVHPRKLSVVSDEDDEFVESIRRDDKENEDDIDDSGSAASQIAEPKNERAVKSFFIHELNKSHSFKTEESPNHSEQNYLASQEEKEFEKVDDSVISKSFFQKELKKSRSSDSSPTANQSSSKQPDEIFSPETSEKELLTASFFRKHMDTQASGTSMASSNDALDLSGRKKLPNVVPEKSSLDANLLFNLAAEDDDENEKDLTTIFTREDEKSVT